MNRPDNLMAYDELDLKLGIKSSLPHVKGTLALSVLLWECADHPSELVFSEQKDKETVLTQELRQWLSDYLSEICEEENIDIQKVISCANDNQLFKSQMEALIVAFELVWKLAKVSFVDSSKAASAERTGGIRYPKKLAYSVNMDIIHSVISSNESAFVRVLLSWIGVDVTFDPECELILLKLLTALAEGAVFKLVDGEKDVIFNQNSIYRKLLETNQPVDVNGDKEAKGSLRILKSLLSDSMNPYLKYSGGSVSAQSVISDRLDDYQKRVETLLRLNATKVIGLDSLDADQEGASFDDLEKTRISTGTNVLLYGVPGSGKSWTIEHEYCKKGTHVERLVFHPDYTYSDFIGQILPVVAEDGQVSYQFTAGPFTNILKDAYLNPTEEYILVIEEINRGNAPAIFGEVFQLLDRKDEEDFSIEEVGESEYGISNYEVAKEVYGDEKHQVRIPSNMFILATMNTADQNVFTLDTAFQRRWNMRQIENNFDKSEHSKDIIAGTKVSWGAFATVINDMVIDINVDMASSEDKRLGTYFARKKELEADRFSEKVLKYLWDDAFKMDKTAIFNENCKSLEDVVITYETATSDKLAAVLRTSVYEKMLLKMQQKNIDNNEN